MTGHEDRIARIRTEIDEGTLVNASIGDHIAADEISSTRRVRHIGDDLIVRESQKEISVVILIGAESRRKGSAVGIGSDTPAEEAQRIPVLPRDIVRGVLSKGVIPGERGIGRVARSTAKTIHEHISSPRLQELWAQTIS